MILRSTAQPRNFAIARGTILNLETYWRVTKYHLSYINFYRVCRLDGSIICSRRACTHARTRNKEGKRRRYRDGKFSRAVQRGSLALPWSTARLFVDRMAERSNASSTSSLTLPQMLGTSPDGGTSPRRAVSPLLEVRRPHCTLNCESCNLFLEDVYRHSTCPLCPWCTTADSVSCSRDRIRYPINYTINVLTQLSSGSRGQRSAEI